MDAREYFEQLRERLINHKVSFCQLAANSLLVYIECEPGDQHGHTIWFDPTWHFCSPQGPLVVSRQAQIDDDEPDPDTALKQVGAPLAILIGKKIEDIKVEPRTLDLNIFFEGDYWIKIFVSDPTDDHFWHITDNTSERACIAQPKAFVYVLQPIAPNAEHQPPPLRLTTDGDA